MSEDTFGIQASDFCPFYVQAQSALMELDAMNRGVLEMDEWDYGETMDRLRQSYGDVEGSPDIGKGGEWPLMSRRTATASDGPWGYRT